jgi:hypothetical protein
MSDRNESGARKNPVPIKDGGNLTTVKNPVETPGPKPPATPKTGK